MTPNIAKIEVEQLRTRHRQDRCVIAGLLLISLVLGVGWTLTALFQRTHLLPPMRGTHYEIGAGQANREYLVDTAHYVLHLVRTVTPHTVERNNSVLLKLVDPSVYGQLRTSLDEAAAQVKNDSLSTVWEPRKEGVSLRAKEVTISGSLNTYVRDVLASRKEKTFVVGFNIDFSGRVYVTKIQEVVKSDRARKS